MPYLAIRQFRPFAKWLSKAHAFSKPRSAIFLMNGRVAWFSANDAVSGTAPGILVTQ